MSGGRKPPSGLRPSSYAWRTTSASRRGSDALVPMWVGMAVRSGSDAEQSRRDPPVASTTRAAAIRPRAGCPFASKWSGSPAHEAAVDDQVYPGDEAGRVAEQEDRRAHHLVGRRHPPHRCVGLELLDLLGDL